MKRTRHSAEQIIGKLKDADAMLPALQNPRSVLAQPICDCYVYGIKA